MLDRTTPKTGTDILIVVPTARATSFRAVLVRSKFWKRRRWAINSKRYRARYDDGQKVLSITARPSRAQTMLTRKGYLPPPQPGKRHSNAVIEAALSAYIDDAGHE